MIDSNDEYSSILQEKEISKSRDEERFLIGHNKIFLFFFIFFILHIIQCKFIIYLLNQFNSDFDNRVVNCFMNKIRDTKISGGGSVVLSPTNPYKEY